MKRSITEALSYEPNIWFLYSLGMTQCKPRVIFVLMVRGY